MLREIDEACGRFRTAWGRGEFPEVSDYLGAARPAGRPDLLRELLAVEVRLRIGEGESPDRAEYLGRFPDDPETIESVFRDLDAARTVATVLLPGSVAPPSAAATGRPDPGEGPGDIEMASSADLTGRPAPIAEGPAIPDHFGRYRAIRLLGRGGFGRVYLAADDDLRRDVAVKVPHPWAVNSPSRLEAFLAEARMVARLKHPAIVSVLDVGRQEDGRAFVVQEYIEGRTLAALLRESRPAPDRLAELLIDVAEAAHHAHKAALVHRDLKPSNILIDLQGRPHVADFGLAVSEEVQRLKSGEVAGTPSFMAPEQVRGETHRLDGRTDVWALGVILYLGLSGRLPFAGGEVRETFVEVLHRDPRPLRQIDDAIPRELERIGARCLAKRMTDRYQTAGDLAEDLRLWRAGSSSPRAVASPSLDVATIASSPEVGPTRVVPKGLRAFDGRDADFFEALLPGPRDRLGLPESLRFWKARIEERDRDRTFGVGLIYGPSGSGKSSLVRAGLLPRLAADVRVIDLEATATATESRLHAALRREFPGLPPSGDLADAIAALRDGPILPVGGKVLIVLDQFESWLQAHPIGPADELVRALRQCDGRMVQALLLVRDDFWMAIARFFRALETPLVEGRNSAAVELFEPEHARKVLAEFGRARGRLPEAPEPPGPDSGRFLDQAVRGLADSAGRVIPVRLSLFAQMVQHRAWVPSTLRDLGGVEGIGETFLEETFRGASAPPSHRVHLRAVQGVLEALLPEPSSDLKGAARSSGDLRQAAGYDDRPGEFAELMDLLDAGLRMVTPVDLRGDADAPLGEATPLEPSYQLTHDFLVPPVRSWLNRARRSTRQGRAELRLAELTSAWRERPGPRRLPSTWEWIDALWQTRRATWTDDTRAMLRAASRRTALRAGTVLGLAALIGLAGWASVERFRADSVLQAALEADVRLLPDLIPRVSDRHWLLRAELETLERSSPPDSRDRLVASLVLSRVEPTPRRAVYLRDRLLGASPDELALIRDALGRHLSLFEIPAFSAVMSDEDAEPGARLRAACALATLNPSRWVLDDEAPAIARALLDENRHEVPRWVELLGPTARDRLRTPLAALANDPALDSTARSLATECLAEVLPGPTGTELAELIVEADPDAFRFLVRELDSLGDHDRARAVLRRALDGASGDDRARRVANAAVALLTLDDPEPLWAKLRHDDDPIVRALLIQRLAGLPVGPRLLLDRLGSEADPGARQALLLTWAEVADTGRVGPKLRGELVEAIGGLYRDDPDPGVHSAARLALDRWGNRAIVDRLDAQVRAESKPPAGRRWEAGPNGHRFALVGQRGAAEVGPPDGRGLAVASTEVTLGQFRTYRADRGLETHPEDDPDVAAGGVSWLEAARYCNWLSKRAKIPRSDWCYPEPIDLGVRPETDVLDRPGYRLPTEAEWEWLCRAGMLGGELPDREPPVPRDEYAWTWLNSGDRPHPVAGRLPNPWGLFDTLGNLWEWCHDDPNRPASDPGPGEVLEGRPLRIARGGAFDRPPAEASPTSRLSVPIDDQGASIGFRVVRTIPARAP